MELLLLVSALRSSSCRKIIAIVPYFGYLRMDRQAADVAELLETVGIDRIMSVDMLNGQIQGFFSPRVPVDNLEAQ